MRTRRAIRWVSGSLSAGIIFSTAAAGGLAWNDCTRKTGNGFFCAQIMADRMASVPRDIYRRMTGLNAGQYLAERVRSHEGRVWPRPQQPFRADRFNMDRV